MSNAIDASAIDKIAGLALQAGGLTVEVNGRTYTPIPLLSPPIPRDPEPEPIKFRRLSSMVEYLTQNRDSLPLEKLVLHVASGTAVELLGPLRDAPYQRFKYAVAIHEEPVNHEAFEEPQSIEDVIIQLQVGFADGGDRTALLTLLSNVKDENVKVAEDDGVTQVVTVRTGAVLKGLGRVPNPVTLLPYRTFRDVPQPAGTFVIRVQGSSGGANLPSVRLIPADGEIWKLAATDNIAAFLRTRGPESVKVLS